MHTDIATGIIGDSDANRGVPKLLEQLRVLRFVTKNSVGTEKKLHVGYLSITSSRELRLASPLTWSLQLLQEEHAQLDLTPVSSSLPASSGSSDFL
jgi:hypothetical protein